MMVGVKLSEWARSNGVSRQSAAPWFHAGVLPVAARQLAGTVVTDDLVRDTVEVLASFCARLYGRRPARRRAEMALATAGNAAA